MLRYHVVIARVICAHWACLVVVLASYPQPPLILGGPTRVALHPGRMVRTSKRQLFRARFAWLCNWLLSDVCDGGPELLLRYHVRVARVPVVHWARNTT